jgi:two-component system, NarL family, response regulator DevR
MAAALNPLESLNKLRQIKQLVRGHAVLTCVYPQLFAIQWVAEHSGMESPNPRLFSASFEEAKSLLKQHDQPFLVITTERLMDGSGLDLIRHAKAQIHPHHCLLVLTHNHRLSIPQTLAAGADALVLEDSINRQSGALLGGLQAIVTGQTYLDPALEACNESDDHEEIEALSARQLEILQLVAAGLSNREIAERLHLAPTTARDHVQAILKRLQVKNRGAAAVAGVRMGLVR